METTRYTGKIQLKTRKGFEDIFSASSNTLEVVEKHTKKDYVLDIYPGLSQRDMKKAKLTITDNNTGKVITEKEWD